ncbi:MAG: 1-acyl-sn-glycerol-3-phosphate acyltransferase [Bacteroidales bacterium]|nr:1-acyl-sn-glycerol-3-phosphate acyltransferase [Bacteroidales bacterium]
MKKLWIAVVKLFGWKFDLPSADRQQEMDRCVIIMVPHTSAYDYFVGAACVWMLGNNSRIFIKKEYFNWFTRPFLNAFGGIAVDRGNRNNGLVEQAVHLFDTNEKFSFVITPEGTRKAVKRWKRGFYEIAVKAQVPIVLSYVDYKTKHMGIGPTFWPTGDFNADMPKIMEFYRNSHPKHPEGYNTNFYA